ncbi:Hypothetical protein GLP15_605 [Giardia lamblia P15]|uniref:Rapamycin-insensitive companion of mTOR domain-containing protein n=1 Tax=Giardia intestinalis (strain P15) TaxID=658858 RepID=E1F572_GIAIA|nr:Hypothetical protein GLP15_605 [Giardia lamblia P15]
MYYDLTPFEQNFTPLIQYATHFEQYEENVRYFRVLPDAIATLIEYISTEMTKSAAAAKELQSQINKAATEISIAIRTLMLTQYRLIQRALFKLITALCFEGSRVPRRLLRNGCQILMARHLEIHSLDHSTEDTCLTDCISAMISIDPKGISTAIINAVASIATDKADALQLECMALCQQMVIYGVSNSEPAMRVFFDQLTEPERINEVYINSAIILRLISSKRTPEEDVKIKHNIDRLLVPLCTKTEMPDDEEETRNRPSNTEHLREAEDIQRDLDDVALKFRILESNRQTIERAIQNTSDMMLAISEELDSTNNSIRHLSHIVHNYQKVLNTLGDDSSKHQLEISTRKDLLSAQHSHQVEDHKRAELESKLVQIQSAKTAYTEKYTALSAQIEELQKKESALYEELRQKNGAQQRAIDMMFLSEGLRIPVQPIDKHVKTDLHGKKQRSLNTGPSSFKAGGSGVSATLTNDTEISISQVGKKLISHMCRVRQEAVDARLKKQPQNFEYQIGSKTVRVSSRTEITKHLLYCLLSTHTGLLYLLSLPCGLKGVLNNLLTLKDFDGTKRAIYELLFDILGDKRIFKSRFLQKFVNPAQLFSLKNSTTYPSMELHRFQSATALTELSLSHSPANKLGLQQMKSTAGLRQIETKGTLLTSTTTLRNKQKPNTSTQLQPSHLRYLSNLINKSSQTNSVIESHEVPIAQRPNYIYNNRGCSSLGDVYMYSSSNYGPLAALAMEISPNFSMTMSGSFSGIMTSELNLLEILFIDELYLASLGCSANYGSYTDSDIATDHMMWVLITLARAGLVEVLCWELMSDSSMSYGPALMLLTLFLSKCVQLLPKTYSNPIISLSSLISYYISNLCEQSKANLNTTGLSMLWSGTSSGTLAYNSFLNFQRSISIYAEMYEFVFTQGYFNQYVNQINLSQQQIDLHHYIHEKELERHGNNLSEDSLFERLRQLVETRSKLKFSDIIKTYIAINDNGFAKKMLKERVLHINLELYRIRLDYLDQAIQKLFVHLTSTKGGLRVGISSIECKTGFDFYYSRIDSFLKSGELSDYPSYWGWNSISALIGFLNNQFGHAGETQAEVKSVWTKVTPIFENIISFMDGTIKQAHDSIQKLKRANYKKLNLDTASTIIANLPEGFVEEKSGIAASKSLIPTIAGYTPGSTPSALLLQSIGGDQDNSEAQDLELCKQCNDFKLYTLFELPVTEYTLYICRTCIGMLSLLVHHSEGIALIRKSRLASVLYNILDNASKDKGLLSKENYKANLSLGVIAAIGVLSSTDLGLYIMASLNLSAGRTDSLWKPIKQLIKQDTRPELAQHLVMSLNYSASLTQTSLLPGIVELYSSTSEKADIMNHSLRDKKNEAGRSTNVTNLLNPDVAEQKEAPPDKSLTIHDICPTDHFNILFSELNKESRECMAEALKSSNVSTRYFSTFHIAAMVRQRHTFLKEYNVTCLCSSCLSVFEHHFVDLRSHSIQLKTLNDVFWAAECLVAQCRDPITEIAICALIALEELSSEKNVLILEYIVSLKPSFVTYGRIGEVLIERLASCTTGLHYIKDEKNLLMPLLEYWANGLAPAMEWTLNLEARIYSNIDLGIAQNYSLPAFFQEKIPYRIRGDAASLTFYKADELMYDHLVMPHHTRLGRSSLYLPYSSVDMPPAFRELFIANTGQIKENDTVNNASFSFEKPGSAISFLTTEAMTGRLNKGMSNPCGFFSDYMNQYNGPDSYHRNRVSNILPTHLRPCLLAELAKTSQGCDLITKTGIFKAIMEILLNPVENRFTLQYRASLWSIAFIAQSEVGFKEIIARASLDPSCNYLRQDSVLLNNETLDGNDDESIHSVYTCHSVASSFITAGEQSGTTTWNPINSMTNAFGGPGLVSNIPGYQLTGLSLGDAPMLSTRGKLMHTICSHRGGTISNIFNKTSCSTSHLYETSSQCSTSNESFIHYKHDWKFPPLLLHLLHNLAIFSDSYKVKQTATLCISHCCLNSRIRSYFVDKLGWEITRLSRSGESYGCLPPVELFDTFYRAKLLSNEEVETFIMAPLRSIHTSHTAMAQTEGVSVTNSHAAGRSHNMLVDTSLHIANIAGANINIGMSIASSLNCRERMSVRQQSSSALSLDITDEKIEEIKMLLKYTTTTTSPLPVELSGDSAVDYIWHNLESIYDKDFVLRTFKLEERYKALGLIEVAQKDENDKPKKLQSTPTNEIDTPIKTPLHIMATRGTARIKGMRLMQADSYVTNPRAYLPCGCTAGIIISKASIDARLYQLTNSQVMPSGQLLTTASLTDRFQALCRSFIGSLPKEVAFYLLHDNDNEDIINVFIQQISIEGAKIQRRNKKFTHANELVTISSLRSGERLNMFESQILMYCNYLLSAYEPDVQQASTAIGILVDNSMPYRNPNIDYCKADNVPRDSFFLVISQILATWPLLPIARRALLKVCDRPTLRTLKVLDSLSTFAEDIEMTGLA